jgi:hypothetical protein
VFLTAAGVRQRADVYSGASYSSSSDIRVHFGLGTASSIEALEIDWPDGVKQMVDAAALNRDGLNRILRIEEPTPNPVK